MYIFIIIGYGIHQQIKMAKLNILDTGYVSATNTGTRLESTSMANSGSAIELNAVDFKPSTGQTVDDTPSI